MNVINNFQKIGQALHFDSEDQFYFIQILKRNKDNPAFPQNNRLVKYYVVRSVDYFYHIEPEVKAICEATTARAYISLNRRSFKKCTMETLTEIATIVRSEQYLHLPSMFSSVVGRTSAERDKTWIIDIDTKDEGIRQEVRDFLPTIEPNPGLNKIWMEIETLHGVHLISTPFNLQKFKARFPDIDVHKDNPTLLYFKSLC